MTPIHGLQIVLGKFLNFALNLCCTCKFQSLSNIMTVSAAVSVIPRPPARVERRKMKAAESELSGTYLRIQSCYSLLFPQTLTFESHLYLFGCTNKWNSNKHRKERSATYRSDIFTFPSNLLKSYLCNT